MKKVLLLDKHTEIEKSNRVLLEKMTKIFRRKNFSVSQNQICISKFPFTKKKINSNNSCYLTNYFLLRKSHSPSPFNKEHLIPSMVNDYSKKYVNSDFNAFNYSTKSGGKICIKNKNGNRKMYTTFSSSNLINKKIFIRKSKIINREIFYVEICQVKEFR